MQNDRPDAFVQVVLHALDSPDDVGPGALGQGSNAPILVDRSRPALAGAADLIAQRSPIPNGWDSNEPARTQCFNDTVTR